MEKETSNNINPKLFGEMPNGKKVYEFVLKNKNGLEVKVINYGGIITSLKTHDKNGELGNIILGFDNLDGYLGDHPYFGALIGRYANRIARGNFELEGKEYTLSQNNGVNHLHGGDNGYHRKFWDINFEDTEKGESIILTYKSKDMEEGYPGNIENTVRYTLTDENELIVNYEGRTDKPTVLNMTQHSYFNLSAGKLKNILSHQLKLNSIKYLPVDSTLIPIGELRAVEGTPFDFRELTPIGKNIEAVNEQIKIGLGYDHCWVLKEANSEELIDVGELFEPQSGRVMQMMTTEPGIQFYSGNFLDGSIKGIEGEKYEYRYAVCLETEKYPDSPNQENFPSSVLMPGETYKSTTVFKFGVK